MNKKEFTNILKYEIMSRTWLGFIGNGYLQNLVSRFLVWKITRKYRRYLKTLERIEKMDQDLKNEEIIKNCR